MGHPYFMDRLTFSRLCCWLSFSKGFRVQFGSNMLRENRWSDHNRNHHYVGHNVENNLPRFPWHGDGLCWLLICFLLSFQNIPRLFLTTLCFFSKLSKSLAIVNLQLPLGPSTCNFWVQNNPINLWNYKIWTKRIFWTYFQLSLMKHWCCLRPNFHISQLNDVLLNSTSGKSNLAINNRLN